jgi:hypothetical protein
MSTAKRKMPVYAREGIGHAWLVEPIAKTLEVYTLDPRGRWSEAVTYREVDVVRAAPVDAVELDLVSLGA